MQKKIIVIILSIISVILIATGIFYSNQKNPEEAKSNIPITKNIEYEIKPSDTIETIANKFNISTRELMLNNKLQNIDIESGAKIMIPNQTILLIDEKTTYDQLAEQFKIDKNKIQEANNKKGYETNVNKGEEIIIPNKIVYVVKKGDTVETIANKFNVTPYVLTKENEIKGELKENDLILIPNYDDIEKMISGPLTKENRDKYQTKKDQESILKLVNIGTKMYNENTYKTYRQDNECYFVTYGDLKANNIDVSNDLISCLDDDIIIKFPKNKGQGNMPQFTVKNNCISHF